MIHGFNIVTAEYFAKLERPADPGRGHSDAHAGGGDRRTRVLHEAARLEGRDVRQRHRAAIARHQGSRRQGPRPAGGRHAVFYDQFGLDSDYDYDPVWQKCRELGVAPTFHTGGRGLGLRNNPSNFTFNHIGHFAAAGHAVAKGLFLGGVTRRFPDLRFGFLEGGVGWGCRLFADLIEHWERRGAKGIAYMNPEKLDRKMLRQMVDKYGYEEIAAELDRRDGWPKKEEDSLTGGVPVLDDYAACKITPEAGLGRPVRDPVFLRLRGGRQDERGRVQQLQPVRRQDPGDLQLRYRPFRRARHEPGAARGLGTGRGRSDYQSDFRDFTFTNAVKLWGTQNPRFFEGTSVAKQAAEALNAQKKPPLLDAAK